MNFYPSDMYNPNSMMPINIIPNNQMNDINIFVNKINEFDNRIKKLEQRIARLENDNHSKSYEPDNTLYMI